MMSRKVLHLDLDAFFCAVEAKRNPDLQGKPFAVGGQPDQRGVVASCSYAARQFGIRSAMPMARAIKQCPDLIIVPSHYKAYQDASRQVMDRLHNLTPLVEQISIDEAFLDVSDLPEPGEVVARNLQATINNELGLPCSLGVASNKLVAKIANNIGKASVKTDKPPNTIKVVPPGQEATFLTPLPVRELWGVGPKTAEQLAQLGIHTIGDLARWPETDLGQRFGKLGHDLARRASGIDDRPVETEHEAKSISQETTFARDIDDGDQLCQCLRQLSEKVGRRLRKKNLSGTRVKIKLRWADFTTLTRQMTLDHPTNLDSEIHTAAEQLFERTWPPGKRVRLVGVGVSGFEPLAYQLGLWEAGDAEQDYRLQTTLDELRDRFGDEAIQRGSQLKGENASEEE
jgi:DNA polymerase-4